MAERSGVSAEEEALEVASIWGDRTPKPKNPDIHYLYNMIINIRIRQKYIDAGHPIESFSIGMMNELRVAEVDFQAIHIDQYHNETIQILVSDPEEREHVIHILLEDQHILCMENGGKRYYSRFVDDDEKLLYKWMRKEELEEMEKYGNLDKRHHEVILNKIS